MFFIVMGSLGVLIPLLLHLIQNRRRVKVSFSTLRFLRLAQKQSSRRVRLENIVLWLIRTCLLVLLALAFAMPMLRSRGTGTVFGRAPRDVAIVIDGSYSMDYDLGRTTVWTKAVEMAVAIVEGLGEQDRFCIFVARDHVDPLIEQLSGDGEAAVSRLQALTYSQTSSQLAPTVMDANEALLDSEIRREREIHIITDGQALPWDDFGGDGSEDAVIGTWDPAKIDETRTTVFVSLLGVDKPENVSPTELKVEPSLILAEVPSKATVRLGLSGLPPETRVTFRIDDDDVATQAIIPTGDSAELVFSVPPLSAGWHAASVDVPDDNLQIDNSFYVVLRVEDRFPALCVGSRDDTVFIRAALKAGQSGGSIASEWVEPGGIDGEKLKDYACVFLCNAIPLDAGEVSALEAFVDEGGLLVIFPGNAAVPGDYFAWNCLPAKPTGIAKPSVSKRKGILHWNARQHALLESMRLDDSPLSVLVRKRLVWDKLEERAEAIISHAEVPFMAGRPYGRGYVLLFSVSADRTWTDFPLSPFYLPVLLQIIEFGAGVGSHPQFAWCAEELSLSRYLPEATLDTALKTPDGQPLRVRSAVVGGSTVLHVENLDKAGIYTMSDPGGRSAPALAVNMSRKESELRPIASTAIRDVLALENVEVARDLEALQAQLLENRIGRTFGEQLLWLVLVLAALEFLLANRLLREPPTLSKSLGIESAGDAAAMPATGEGV